MRRLPAIVALCLVVAAACTATRAEPRPSILPVPISVPPSPDSSYGAKGIEKIEHLVFIVMENRSFDHYFGTYPGADGLPKNVCVPDPMLHKRCTRPYHDTELVNRGGPHGMPHAIMDVNGGRMDGFIRALELHEHQECLFNRSAPRCNGFFGPQQQPDVMGYHTRAEIPNYWEYADNFVLQDRMFESVESWTLPSHLFLVSGWAATCRDPREPMSCRSDPAMQGADTSIKAAPERRPVYGWTDITYLLHKHDVSWAYYTAPGTCLEGPCGAHNHGTPRAMNPLLGFTTVHENRQLGNIKTHQALWRAAADGTLPQVSWIKPGRGFSEHPNSGSLAKGQAFVT